MFWKFIRFLIFVFIHVLNCEGRHKLWFCVRFTIHFYWLFQGINLGNTISDYKTGTTYNTLIVRTGYTHTSLTIVQSVVLSIVLHLVVWSVLGNAHFSGNNDLSTPFASHFIGSCSEQRPDQIENYHMTISVQCSVWSVPCPICPIIISTSEIGILGCGSERDLEPCFWRLVICF